MNSDEKKVMALRREEGSVCEVSVGRRRTEHVFFFNKVLAFVLHLSGKDKAEKWCVGGNWRFTICMRRGVA